MLTLWPLEDLPTAETVVRYYAYRWRVERYHYVHVRKSGCHIEDLPRETFGRLNRALAGYRIVARRLRWWTYLAREQPEQLCTTIFRPTEGAALYATHSRRRPRRICAPPCARLPSSGAFSDGGVTANPGGKTLWRGYRRLEDRTVMWELLHPPE